MTRRRWIADEFSNGYAALIGEHADHLIRVLRVRLGQQFDIVASHGVVYRGRVRKISESRVEFELLGEIDAATPVLLTLLLSVFKFDRMEWAIEKCTELGVAKIVPVIARRTDAHLAAASVKRGERWRRIATQAAEQSRRAGPPEVTPPLKLQDAVSLPGALRIVLSEMESRTQLGNVLAASCGEVLLAIGPEGGWTNDELQVFQKTGWISASLGPTILRVETAAIAATAIIVAARG